MDRRSRPRVFAIAVAMAAGAVVAACGGGTDEPEAQPAPGVTRFTEEGTFDDLPRYPRSDPVGTREEVRGAITRSFEVRNARPEQILDFYAQSLPADGWDEVEAPRAVNQIWRGSWLRSDATLEVSSAPAPTLNQDDPVSEDPVAQYSLILRTG